VGFFGSLKHIDMKSWEGRVPASPNIATLFSTGIWLYNGFVGNSSLAGEVTSSSVFVYGQFGALAIDTVMYLLPLLVTLQVHGEWGDAYLVTAFDRVWPGIGIYISIAGAASGFGLYLSSMACYARTLWGAGDMHWVPAIFGKTHGGVPRIAVLTLFITSIGLGAIGDFDFLIDLEFVIASVIYLLFAAAFIALRYQHPNSPRPYRVPGGKFTAWFVTAPVFMFMSATLFSSLTKW
jgi:amino acid transporter